PRNPRPKAFHFPWFYPSQQCVLAQLLSFVLVPYDNAGQGRCGLESLWHGLELSGTAIQGARLIRDLMVHGVFTLVDLAEQRHNQRASRVLQSIEQNLLPIESPMFSCHWPDPVSFAQWGQHFAEPAAWLDQIGLIWIVMLLGITIVVVDLNKGFMQHYTPSSVLELLMGEDAAAAAAELLPLITPRFSSSLRVREVAMVVEADRHFRALRTTDNRALPSLQNLISRWQPSPVRLAPSAPGGGGAAPARPAPSALCSVLVLSPCALCSVHVLSPCGHCAPCLQYTSLTGHLTPRIEEHLARVYRPVPITNAGCETALKPLSSSRVDRMGPAQVAAHVKAHTEPMHTWYQYITEDSLAANRAAKRRCVADAKAPSCLLVATPINTAASTSLSAATNSADIPSPYPTPPPPPPPPTFPLPPLLQSRPEHKRSIGASYKSNIEGRSVAAPGAQHRDAVPDEGPDRDRDVSAALNIRRTAAGQGPRPRELSSWLGRPPCPTQAVWARSGWSCATKACCGSGSGGTSGSISVMCRVGQIRMWRQKRR
ncbi:hypothetical protein QJQ45_022593, partial [Haematococcus lacustris]